MTIYKNTKKQYFAVAERRINDAVTERQSMIFKHTIQKI